MKTENIIHLFLGVGLIGLAAYSIKKINEQGKEIAALKEQVAKTGKLSSTIKDVKETVNQITNRVKEGV